MQGKKQHPPAQQSSVAALEAQLKELKIQVQTLTELAARAQADLQNARARLERDAEDIRKFAAESVLRKILPTIDNFQRAFQHLPEDLKHHAWTKGVQATEQELLRHLTELGLTKMSPLGNNIDPVRHEVLLMGPGKIDTIIEVLEDGYELNGKMLRPAKVKVGDGTVTPPSGQRAG